MTSLSQKTSWRDQVFRRANPIVIPIAERIQNSNIQPSKIRNTVNPSFNRTDRVDRMEPIKSPTSSSSACQPMRGGGINDLEKLRSTFGRVNIQDRMASIASTALLTSAFDCMLGCMSGSLEILSFKCLSFCPFTNELVVEIILWKNSSFIGNKLLFVFTHGIQLLSIIGGVNQPGYENMDAVYDAKLFTKTVEMENLRKSHTASSWFYRENVSKNHNMALNSEGKIDYDSNRVTSFY